MYLRPRRRNVTLPTVTEVSIDFATPTSHDDLLVWAAQHLCGLSKAEVARLIGASYQSICRKPSRATEDLIRDLLQTYILRLERLDIDNPELREHNQTRIRLLERIVNGPSLYPHSGRRGAPK